MKLRVLSVLVLGLLLPVGVVTGHAQGTQAAVLTAVEAAKMLPATVYFRGQSAPVQARNSGGVRFADGGAMLAVLVDTSGYSTSVKEKYQAYLITEAALEIEGHRLPAGVYGCGFIAGDTFVVQDVGAHDLLTARSKKDAELRRPTPLQVIGVSGESGEYRLYVGRSYIGFKLAGN